MSVFALGFRVPTLRQLAAAAAAAPLAVVEPCYQIAVSRAAHAALKACNYDPEVSRLVPREYDGGGAAAGSPSPAELYDVGGLAHDVRIPVSSLQACATLLLESYELVGGEREILIRLLGVANEARKELDSILHFSGDQSIPIESIRELLQRTKIQLLTYIRSLNQDSLEKDTDKQRLIRSIIDSTQSIGDMVELKPKKRNFSIEQLFRITKEQLSQVQRKSESELVLRIDPDVLLDRYGPYVHVERILFNLVKNALEHTKNGQVILSVRNGERLEEIIFEVTDNGEGILADMFELVFMRGKRASEGSNTNGCGLGLANVKALGKQINAHVRIARSSQAVADHGTTFEVRLNLAQPREPARATPRLTPSTLERCGFITPQSKVLHLEDNGILTVVMKRTLSKFGIDKLLQVTSIAEAEEILHREIKPDVLISDNHVIGGLSIDSIIPLAISLGIPVIFNSDAGPEIKDKCRELGIHYLPKPLTTEKLRPFIKPLAPSPAYSFDSSILSSDSPVTERVRTLTLTPPQGGVPFTVVPPLSSPSVTAIRGIPDAMPPTFSVESA